MKDLVERLLQKGLQVECEREFDLANASTIGVGGKAAFAFKPKSLKELMRLVDAFDEDSVSFLVLGKMSNVLPPDGRLEKPIVLTTNLRELEFSKGVFAEAGVTSGMFIKECAKHGKTGAEFLSGIPCTIGGAAYMNAGAGGKYLSDIVKRVLVYKQRKLCLIAKKNCGYEYKRSVFMENDAIILGVEFALDDAATEEILDNRKCILQGREWLPKGRSAGCIFKNPLGESAGKLIEGAGLKGLRVGGAVVSEIHANFIINDKGATAADVKKLIALIKNAVFAQYKVRLEEEIRIID